MATKTAVKRRQLLAVAERCEQRAEEGRGRIAGGRWQGRNAGSDQRRIGENRRAAHRRGDHAAGDTGEKQHHHGVWRQREVEEVHRR
jgi:hypothetical protein